MSIKRAREYPTKQKFESTDDYVKRLRDAIQEEATDRIQDFDILQLANVPHVDVRAYGAAGDGTTNDAIKIQAAIDSLTYGGDVLLPVGDYSIGTTTITVPNGVNLRGMGTDKYWGGDGTQPTHGTRISYTGTGAAIQGDIARHQTISRITLDLTGSSGASVIGLDANNCQHTHYEDIRIEGTPSTGYAIKIHSTNGQHCTMFRVDVGQGAIKVEGTDERITTTTFISVRGSTYEFDTTGNITLINTTTESDQSLTTHFDFDDCTSVSMFGCDIEGNGTNAINLTDVVNFQAVGVDFSGWTGTNKIVGAPSSSGFAVGRGVSPTTTWVANAHVDYELTHGDAISLRSATTEKTALSGASVTWTNAIPAGSLVLGVSSRVTTSITGASGYQLGDGTDVDRWADVSLVTAGDTTNMTRFTISSPVYYTSATSIVVTAKTSNFTAGAIRLTLHYWALDAPSS